MTDKMRSETSNISVQIFYIFTSEMELEGGDVLLNGIVLPIFSIKSPIWNSERSQMELVGLTLPSAVLKRRSNVITITFFWFERLIANLRG